MTGTPLAMSFLIAGWSGSYAIAGLVGAVLMAGLGVAGPVRGRVADRRGAAGQLVGWGGIYGVGVTPPCFPPLLVSAGGLAGRGAGHVLRRPDVPAGRPGRPGHLAAYDQRYGP